MIDKLATWRDQALDQDVANTLLLGDAARWHPGLAAIDRETSRRHGVQSKGWHASGYEGVVSQLQASVRRPDLDPDLHVAKLRHYQPTHPLGGLHIELPYHPEDSSVLRAPVSRIMVPTSHHDFRLSRQLRGMTDASYRPPAPRDGMPSPKLIQDIYPAGDVKSFAGLTRGDQREIAHASARMLAERGIHHGDMHAGQFIYLGDHPSFRGQADPLGGYRIGDLGGISEIRNTHGKEHYVRQMLRDFDEKSELVRAGHDPAGDWQRRNAAALYNNDVSHFARELGKAQRGQPVTLRDAGSAAIGYLRGRLSKDLDPRVHSQEIIRRLQASPGILLNHPLSQRALERWLKLH